MADFVIKPLENTNTPDMVKQYLGNLKVTLESLQANGIESLGGVKVQQLLTDLDEQQGIFTQKRADIANYPKLWSASSRVGASTILVEGISPIENEVTPSTFDALLAILENAYKVEKDKEKKNKIAKITSQLQAYQQNVALDYMARLRMKTAEELIGALSTYDGHLQDRKKKLNAELIAIRDMPLQSITTTAQVFDYTKRVNNLRNELLQFRKDVGKYSHSYDDKITNERFNHLSKQLSVVTKRELDYYYDHPKEFTTFDKVRVGVKAAAATIGALTIIPAFVLWFFPPLWPIAGLLTLVSLAALVPLANTIFEVGRNLYYGRSPTKLQTFELGLALPLLSLIILGAHAIVPIATAIVGKGAAVINKLAAISGFIGTKFNAGFGSTFNTLGVVGSSFETTKAFTSVQTEKAAANQSVLKLNDSIAILEHGEVDSNAKKKIADKKSELQQQMKGEQNTQLFYVYKQLNSNEVHAQESHSHDIHQWDAGLFASQASRKIQTAVRKYKNLPANSSIQARKDALQAINTAIAEHPHAKDKEKYKNSHILKLENYVVKELSNLKTLHETLNTSEDAKAHLVFKP